MNGLDRCFFDQRESQQHGDDCGYSYISLGRLHPYGSGSGSSSGSGRRRTRRGLSDSPTAPTTPTSASDNASDATLTDSELPLARDSTLLVQNGESPQVNSSSATVLDCLSDSPTTPTTPTSASDNASDATLTDSELPLARDSTLLVQNGESPQVDPFLPLFCRDCLSDSPTTRTLCL
nr:uncharacterized protein LOC117983246 [Maniola hyperantus]